MKASKAISPIDPNSYFAQLLNAGVGDPKTFQRGEIVEGVYEGNGLVSIPGLKANALLHTFDLKSNEPAIGTCAPCIVNITGEDEEEDVLADDNKVIVSFAKATDWIAAKNAFESKSRLPARVIGMQRKGRNVVGLKVIVGSLAGFIPRSQVKGLREAEELIGQELNLAVEHCDPALNKLVFNLNAVREELEAARQQEIAAKVQTFEVGAIVTGKVLKWLDCGALVDLGDKFCGLLHHSEIVPDNTGVRGSSKLDPGTLVTVTVIGKDEQRGRVSLSQKQAARRAFVAGEPANKEFEGSVVNVQHYGVFVEIAPGVSGLLHKSHVDGPLPKQGDVVKVRCLKCDDSGERIDLGSL